MLSGGDLDVLAGVPWRVAHVACVEDDAAHYWFGLSEVTTPEGLIEKMCHMGEKNWPGPETDWYDFVRRTFLVQ